METPKEFLDALREWCDKRYGRQTKLARMLGFKPQLINDWFSGKAVPMWATGLQIQAFLNKSDHARRAAIGEKPQPGTPYMKAHAKKSQERRKRQPVLDYHGRSSPDAAGAAELHPLSLPSSGAIS
jgi:hypothetical protein